MSEGNGPTVVVVTPGEAGAGEGGGGGEVVEGAAVEAAEVIAPAAVEIAEIEANRDVALAVIHQEGEADYAAARHSEELTECRTTIARLEGELEALRNPPVVEVLLTPEPSLEPPLSPPEGQSESEAEGGPRESPVELVEAPPVEEPPKPRRKFIRWT